ncbi:MAG: sugar kinase, partial [Deltaproteobacteria bacterium]|nr:sugar kinase [Deltaproteobacteria bacterium]
GRANALHIDGLRQKACRAAADEARALGIPVIYDAGTLRPGCLDLVTRTDYLIGSEKFFRRFQTDGDLLGALSRLSAMGPRQVVVTLGSKGSHGFDGRSYHFQPAFAVKALDTTGAGDVYHGAYIYGIMADWNMADCMKFASAVAAMKCTQIGGRTGIPTLGQVEEFLSRQKGSQPLNA